MIHQPSSGTPGQGERSGNRTQGELVPSSSNSTKFWRKTLVKTQQDRKKMSIATLDEVPKKLEYGLVDGSDHKSQKSYKIIHKPLD